MKAADLLSTKYRAELCAAVMLGTGKNVWQAEIDAAVELIDFWRFGAKYAAEIYQMQPPVNEKGVWNRMEFRPLEGFVVAISPFNFIAIGGNLNSAPAMYVAPRRMCVCVRGHSSRCAHARPLTLTHTLAHAPAATVTSMGNTTVWKPASTAILGSYVVYKILKEAGLPDGVINFTPGAGRDVGTHLIKHPNMAGLHFTGGTGTFNHIWREIGENLENYGSYPRIVGETGGKNFHFVHSSADPTHVVMNTIRGAFEYQGQKCSATSRMYAPSNLWPEIKKGLVETLATVKMGCVTEFDSFMCAVIDGASFNNIKGYIDEAKASPECEIIAGGNYDDSVGYFVEPTIIVTTNPRYRSMQEEIFGPVLTIYVYEADKFEETLELCNTTSPYALTGAVFAQDRAAVVKASAALRDAAGNFYINDKCTGSIVGQQPFGGARQSGTNDKSGSAINLLRWTSVRSIKENFIPITDYRYPSVSSKE